MALLSTAKRIFIHNGVTLADPDPSLDEKGVLAFYADAYPELTNSQFDEPQIEVDENGETTATYKVSAHVGTKG